MNELKVKDHVEKLRKEYFVEYESIRRMEIEQQMYYLIKSTFGTVAKYYEFLNGVKVN